MPDEPRAASETRSLSLTALMALAQLPGLRCGALSPLARIAAPAGAPDRDALAAALHALDGDWAALPAALLDPGLSVGLVVADRESQLLGQYLWPQPQGLGPGFRVGVAGAALEAQGPLTLEDVELSLLNQLALGSCAEVPPERFELDAAQLWTLLALVDALGTAAALRQAARASGPPPGVTIGDIEAAWNAGIARPNPGWAVSLAAMLAPEALPADVTALLRDTLARLQDAGLVVVLDSAPGDLLGDLVIPAAGLDLLCRGLSQGGIAFGLARSERVAEDRVEITRVAGWRTPGGIVVAELSALSEGRAELLLTGPSHCAQLLGELLGTSSLPEGTAIPGAAEPSPADLLTLLAPPAAASAPHCSHCGAAVRAGARFCPQCGKAL
ncbi:MAG: zinc ribbon domain-containing protein [Rhodanobacteraceae bacterium]|nr:zinc ribbon domain-containing protein [Rhodanobacteraceae bacterium]